MMRQIQSIFRLILLLTGIAIISAMRPAPTNVPMEFQVDRQEGELKQAALAVLRTKCNVCHRKQNPFKVFSEKNMKKHAPKIYTQVFEKQRMPKGDIKLSDAEYATLKKWLSTQNIK